MTDNITNMPNTDIDLVSTDVPMCNITVSPGVIHITDEDYTRLITYVDKVKQLVSTMEITEDNIKESKKKVAAVNKLLKGLNDERIKIKKQILSPYNEFEARINYLKNRIDDVLNIQKSAIRDLEEREREAKKKQIESLYNERVADYDFASMISFRDFLSEMYLHKTFTMSKVETDLVAFLENIQKDVDAIRTMDSADKILPLYFAHHVGDMAGAVSEYQYHNQITTNLKKLGDEDIVEVSEDYLAVFKVKPEYAKEVIEWLITNGIDYIYQTEMITQ